MVTLQLPESAKLPFLGRNPLRFQEMEDLTQFDVYGLKSSPTYQSLSHYESASIVYDSLQNRGIDVIDQLFMVSKSYHQLFGVFMLGMITKGMQCMVMFRNSIDKSMSFRVSTGAMVLLCSNGLIGFDLMGTTTTKHSKNADPLVIADQATLHTADKFNHYVKRCDELKNEMLTDYEARKLVMNLAQNKCFPADQLLQVWDEYIDPRYVEFADCNRYSMLMAVTEILKEQKTIVSLMEFYKRLAVEFKL